MTSSFFAIAAGLLCGLYGLRLSATLRSEARVLLRWVEILRRLALLIAEETLPLPEALRQAADEPLPADLLVCKVADALESDPLLPLADAFVLQCTSCPGYDVLQRLFTRLGHGSAANRLLAVDQARDTLALLAAKASERADRDAKLYRTLGWTGGVCLTILLI